MVGLFSLPLILFYIFISLYAPPQLPQETLNLKNKVGDKNSTTGNWEGNIKALGKE